MVKIAIRDDDTNFFTKVEDLEMVYREIPEFPVSFAVIPTVTDVSTVGACPDTKGNIEPRAVVENETLVCWLKNRVAQGRCDILLHGVTHGYKFVNEKRLPEMLWRSGQIDLEDVISRNREQLSKAFNYNITCFVAPSNKIAKDCLDSIARLGMDFSGIVPLSFQRPLTVRNIRNYALRMAVRALNHVPYPGILKYSDGHKEINACSLLSLDYLKNLFRYCQRHHLPMAINTHYWDLRDKPDHLSVLIDFVKWAVGEGAVPTKITDILIR